VAIEPIARDTKLIRLAARNGRTLESADPGSHITLALPGAIERQYSLVEVSATSGHYVIAVKRHPQSRGGSRYLVDHLQVGEAVNVRGPRNNFPLVEDAGRSILVAGGIGITPIWSLLQRLIDQGRSWRLAYSCRTAEDTLFLEQLRFLASAQLHFTQVTGKRFDIASFVKDEPDDAHFYCCGPSSMLTAFENALVNRPRSQIHLEAFAPREQAAVSGGFSVELARDGRCLLVKPGQSILDVLVAAGIPAPHSCLLGVCGTCETKVLRGIPDHRDSVLTAKEREDGKTMMICCSGARSDKLVLDI
jgi:ferredoxin-NADP reductase